MKQGGSVQLHYGKCRIECFGILNHIETRHQDISASAFSILAFLSKEYLTLVGLLHLLTMLHCIVAL